MHPAFIIIPVVIVVVIVVSVIRISRKSASHHFKCPSCGEEFSLSFSKSFFTAHSLDGKYSVTCPKCGKNEYMESLPGRK